jgi:hypothetical protein
VEEPVSWLIIGVEIAKRLLLIVETTTEKIWLPVRDNWSEQLVIF